MLDLELRRLVDAPPDVTWRAVADLGGELADHGAPAQVEVTSRDGDERLCAWRVWLRGAPLSWTQRDVIDNDARSIEFELVEGQPSHLVGRWYVGDGESPSLAVIGLELEFDFGLPIVSLPVERELERILTEIISNVAGALEASVRSSGGEQ